MATWSIDGGASIDSNGVATFPKNTGTTDIEYTITYEDDNGCTGTYKITQPGKCGGEECTSCYASPNVVWNYGDVQSKYLYIDVDATDIDVSGPFSIIDEECAEYDDGSGQYCYVEIAPNSENSGKTDAYGKVTYVRKNYFETTGCSCQTNLIQKGCKGELIITVDDGPLPSILEPYEGCSYSATVYSIGCDGSPLYPRFNYDNSEIDVRSTPNGNGYYTVFINKIASKSVASSISVIGSIGSQQINISKCGEDDPPIPTGDTDYNCIIFGYSSSEDYSTLYIGFHFNSNMGYSLCSGRVAGSLTVNFMDGQTYSWAYGVDYDGVDHDFLEVQNPFAYADGSYAIPTSSSPLYTFKTLKYKGLNNLCLDEIECYS